LLGLKTGSTACAGDDESEISEAARMRRTLAVLAIVMCAALPAGAATLPERLAPCLACHGESGQSENPEVPSLGAQPAPYVLIQLYLFREKQRNVELMNEYAKDLSDDDLRQFSDFIAKLPAPKPAEGDADAARVQRAQALIRQNRCDSCHTPTLVGRDNIPRLAGQREDYLAKALREYKSSARVGYEPTMLEVMRPLNDADIADLAYAIAWMK
jgi:cytochrome c553